MDTAHFKLHVQRLILHFVPEIMDMGWMLTVQMTETHYSYPCGNLLSFKSYFKSRISQFGGDTVQQMSFSVPLTSSLKMAKL